MGIDEPLGRKIYAPDAFINCAQLNQYLEISNCDQTNYHPIKKK